MAITRKTFLTGLLASLGTIFVGRKAEAQLGAYVESVQPGPDLLTSYEFNIPTTGRCVIVGRQGIFLDDIVVGEQYVFLSDR